MELNIEYLTSPWFTKVPMLLKVEGDYTSPAYFDTDGLPLTGRIYDVDIHLTKPKGRRAPEGLSYINLLTIDILRTLDKDFSIEFLKGVEVTTICFCECNVIDDEVLTEIKGLECVYVGRMSSGIEPSILNELHAKGVTVIIEDEEMVSDKNVDYQFTRSPGKNVGNVAHTLTSECVTNRFLETVCRSHKVLDFKGIEKLPFLQSIYFSNQVDYMNVECLVKSKSIVQVIFNTLPSTFKLASLAGLEVAGLVMYELPKDIESLSRLKITKYIALSSEAQKTDGSVMIRIEEYCRDRSITLYLER